MITIEIKGIGKSIAEKLLKEFGSVSGIKTTSIESLEKVIGKKKAELVFTYFSSAIEKKIESELTQDK